MAYFVTKYNLSKLISSLDENIPFSYGEYYKQTILTDFALKADIFSKEEAKSLCIAQKLFKRIARLNQDFYIRQAEENSKSWVYKIKAPSYHTHQECLALNSDFKNYPIPRSCAHNRREEYRTYFIENKDKYGYQENKIEPMVLARRLKEKFELSEDVENLLEKNIKMYLADNSGVYEQSYELSRDDILEKIAELRRIIKKNNIDAKKVSTAGYLVRNDLVANIEEKKLLLEIMQQRKVIFYSLMNYYIFSFKEKGLDVTKEFMEILGFQPCRECCHNTI